MIRSEIISDYEAKLKTASAFVTNFITTFQTALVADLERTVVPNLLAGLQYEPPQRKTYIFSTPKSRRWYFANKVPKGSKGGNYNRTHALSKGYRVRVINGDGAVILSVSNPANKVLGFVKGDSRRLQTIGHRINGWVPDAQPISFWANRAKERAPIVAGQVIRSGRFK